MNVYVFFRWNHCFLFWRDRFFPTTSPNALQSNFGITDIVFIEETISGTAFPGMFKKVPRMFRLLGDILILLNYWKSLLFPQLDELLTSANTHFDTNIKVVLWLLVGDRIYIKKTSLVLSFAIYSVLYNSYRVFSNY